MRPPLHIIGITLRCLADPRTPALCEAYEHIEGRRETARAWLTEQMAKRGKVVPFSKTQPR